MLDNEIDNMIMAKHDKYPINEWLNLTLKSLSQAKCGNQRDLSLLVTFQSSWHDTFPSARIQTEIKIFAAGQNVLMLLGNPCDETLVELD